MYSRFILKLSHRKLRHLPSHCDFWNKVTISASIMTLPIKLSLIPKKKKKNTSQDKPFHSHFADEKASLEVKCVQYYIVNTWRS